MTEPSSQSDWWKEELAHPMATDIDDSSFLNLDFSDSGIKEAAERWTTSDYQKGIIYVSFKNNYYSSQKRLG